MGTKLWHKTTLIVLVIVAVALMMALAGCGSDDDDDNDNGDSQESSGELSVSNAWVRASVPMESMDDSDIADDADDADDDSEMDETEDDAGDSDADSDSMDSDMDSGDSEHSTAGAVTGAFMLIENSTDTPERLISASVSADIATVVEIHETTVDENDVMQMRPVEGIDVPANGSVELKPGSYHIMLIDLQTALNPGDTVTLTLTFESGTTLTVDADVREMSS